MNVMVNRMSAVNCLLIGDNAPSLATAEAAALMEFPGTVVTSARNLKEALQREMPLGHGLMVLAPPNPGDLEEAGAAIDFNGLPRWAIVALGPGEAVERVEFVGPEEWSK